MVKQLTLFITIAAFLFVTAGAAPFQITFSEVIEGAESYVYIDPLLDGMKELAGFIYCDTADNTIIIDQYSRADVIAVNLDGTPVKTAHYYSPDGDSLYIYTLLNEPMQMPMIAFTIVSSNDVSSTSVRTDCFTNGSASQSTFISGINRQDIRLEHGPGGLMEGLWFEASLRMSYYYTQTTGPSSEEISTTILYNPDLETELLRRMATSVKKGNLSSSAEPEPAAFTNHYYRYDFNDSYGNYNSSEVSLTSAQAGFDFDYPLVSHTTDLGNTRGVFVGHFSPMSELDEVIFYGSSEDLLGMRAGKLLHAACYSLTAGVPQEIWYTEIPDVRLDYVYQEGHLIAGTLDTSSVIFLDYREGLITDSMDIKRQLAAATFFETGGRPALLNLTGRSFDTIYVYQFEPAIPVYQLSSSGGQPAVPATFTLHQNHPNPFNGVTQLSFDTEVSQHLSLKVFNILGQEIADIAGGVFSPGTHYFFWDGVDNAGVPQSSGIYFAKLLTAESSQIIKLIYVK